jgi:hypothetical protein
MKITLHLIHDDQPTGPRLVRIDQWSGRALCVPRTDLNEIHEHKELDGPCLYFLISQAGTASSPRVYVGEADGFRDRVKDHDANRDWWSSLVVFFSSDESLVKSGIQYLESRCIELLRKGGWCKLDNGNVPTKPSVPEEDKGGLEQFLRNVKIIMPVLGYNLFADAPASGPGKDTGIDAEEVVAVSAFDTIVCPAWEEGFESAFLGQRAWWAIRIRDVNIPKIRYIAIYRVAPISAITHFGEVDRIEPYIGTDAPEGKYKVFLKGEPIELNPHVGIGKNIHLKPQGPKYALIETIKRAKSLDDVFGPARE